NAISGERCAPHPHVFTDRMLRPGDPAYFDILHAYNGYRTCYYRTFAVGSASPALVDAYKRCRDILDRSIAMVKPGVTTADGSEVITRFPAEDLLITAGGQYTVGGALPGVREAQSNLNANGYSAADAVVASARNEGANAG